MKEILRYTKRDFVMNKFTKTTKKSGKNLTILKFNKIW